MQGGAINSFLLDDLSGLRRDLPRRTIKDGIADKLAALIASGVLAAGDELPGERDLAQALSVSRETVRGAVQALAGRGILEVAQGTRTRVARTDLGARAVERAVESDSRLDPNAYDLEAVHAARLLVEQRVVADAAARIAGDALRRLAGSLAVQRDCLGDPVRFLICDREFHVTVYRACGNPLLADIATDLYGYLMEHRRRVVSQPGRIERSLRDHEAIVAALEARDQRAAVAAFAAHETRIYTSTRAYLEGREAGK